VHITVHIVNYAVTTRTRDISYAFRTRSSLSNTDALATLASVRILGINKRERNEGTGREGEKTNEYKIMKRKRY